jgi:hypothetical protein
MSRKEIQKILWLKKFEYIEVRPRIGHEGPEGE